MVLDCRWFALCVVALSFVTSGPLKIPGRAVRVAILDGNNVRRCNNADTAGTFPNLHYALIGYHIAKGYPLDPGRDPGFSRQIFDASYEGHLTDDCRYQLPRGLTGARSINCQRDETEEIFNSRNDYFNSVEHMVQGSFSGFGAKFSANANYKKDQKDMDEQKNKIAKIEQMCNTHFLELDDVNPPPLAASFLQEAVSLVNGTNRSYFRFLDRYGTHYISFAQFGARSIKTCAMTEEMYKTVQEQSGSVSVQAGYQNALVDAQVGYSFSASERETAKEFARKATTKTISIGVGPGSSAASTWLAEAAANPMPIQLRVKPIQDVFTAPFMNGVGRELAENYQQVYQQLAQLTSGPYCAFLTRTTHLENCVGFQNSLLAPKSRLVVTPDLAALQEFDNSATNLKQCVDSCGNTANCHAISAQVAGDFQCYLFKKLNRTSSRTPTLQSNKNFDTYLFLQKKGSTDNFKIYRAGVHGTPHRTQTADTGNECADQCEMDMNCSLFSFAKLNSTHGALTCNLYPTGAIVVAETEDRYAGVDLL